MIVSVRARQSNTEIFPRCQSLKSGSNGKVGTRNEEMRDYCEGGTDEMGAAFFAIFIGCQEPGHLSVLPKALVELVKIRI